MTLLLLALARSTVPLLLAFAATLLHIPAVLRRKIVRTGLVLALVAAASACLSPAGPPVPKNLSLPTIPILQPVESGPMVISSQETPLSETASSVVPWTPGILYGAGILLGTIPLLLGALKLRRILRSARPATNAYVWSELDHAAHRAGIGRPELRISSMAASPFVAGLFRPKIVLPEDETTSQSVRAILSHEVAHIRSRDVAWRLFHRLLCLALWPQPLLWLLLRPARTIEEEACDQDALQGGIRASDYARTLLAVAEGPLPTSAVGMRTPGTSLTRRVAALLQPPTMTPRKRFLFMSFTMTAFVFAVGLAACLAASPQEPDDAAIPQGDLELSVVGAGGKPVTPTSAYLVAYGDAHDQPIVPLRVTQGRIHYRLDKANPKEAAVIVATAPGSAAGFRR
ncbi:M56 family metallopeptidase, partial [bacterium]